MKIAFLGIGSMGQRMCARLIDAGHQVTAWNRSAGPARNDVLPGARWAATPREAATGADLVVAMVANDDASRSIWLDEDNGALAAVGPQAVAVESSTVSPGWITALGQAAQRAGVRLIEAPVSGSLPQAEMGQLIYLASGDREAITQATPALRCMGCEVHRVGALGTGALAKLATNTLLGVQVAAMAEVVGLLARSGVAAAPVIDALSATTVWSPAVGKVAASMLAADYRPLFPVQLIHKDLQYMVDACGGPAGAPATEATRQVFATAAAAGLGERHMTSVATLYSGKRR
ncbi:NAD(P)-dependent oxidoreductase [Stenotrophomonas sp. 24(2023)]|uniref:NAD(P)-dependent oxidoreductase n=1 Tax=Stenotrophomonas sp. 24(2023) TaxID=3068324 RepID=UPI0027E1F323|nr:NAD(P)-dependent oxidoreductase [Stenotrophomonas sp. 24(2023)]WMJ69279.1 NAD(P)-dependent oxidoreductase [Stenotrophomonas sp. 24(2023)]